MICMDSLFELYSKLATPTKATLGISSVVLCYLLFRYFASLKDPVSFDNFCGIIYGHRTMLRNNWIKMRMLNYQVIWNPTLCQLQEFQTCNSGELYENGKDLLEVLLLLVMILSCEHNHNCEGKRDLSYEWLRNFHESKSLSDFRSLSVIYHIIIAIAKDIGQQSNLIFKIVGSRDWLEQQILQESSLLAGLWDFHSLISIY